MRKAKHMTLYCSGFGGHREKIEMTMEAAAKAAGAGWRSLGGVIYCPECTRTWADRNGPDDHRLNTAEETAKWIIRRMLEER